MSNPTNAMGLRDEVIAFQVESVQKWEDPFGKNSDMVKLAFVFTEELKALMERILRESVGEDEEHKHPTRVYDEGCQLRDIRNELRHQILETGIKKIREL